MKVIIAGGRDFSDYELLAWKVWHHLTEHPDLHYEIVSGTARGADKLGEKYANEVGIPVKRFPADWNTHGKAAGPIRNTEMAQYADMLIAFWDGKSKGTNHMIRTARMHKLITHVIKY